MSDITNLRDTILAKSDQLNADDIVGGSISITVTAVKRGDSAEQPVIIHYQGDNGRPYKPCKTMRRVLIAGWGENGAAWVGRSMTLFNEPSVKFGGVAVGGIRISHMTDIGNGLLLTPNASKGKKQSVSIKPMNIRLMPAAPDNTAMDACLDAIARCGDLDELRAAAKGFPATLTDEQKATVASAYAERKACLDRVQEEALPLEDDSDIPF